MAKTAGQSVKPLILLKILMENTDENHKLIAEKICDIMLEEYGVSAERKSIYRYMDVLDEAGFRVERDEGGYYIKSRAFHPTELTLLVDVIQSSRFITEKKSDELIEKFESFLSVHEAQSLRRQVYVANRIKSMNESIYENVDSIHTAISKRRRITFHYFDWNEKKEKLYRHDGALYMVEPVVLCWEDENYYLVAKDVMSDKVKHYRVDKMEHIEVTDEQSYAEKPDSEGVAKYSSRHFGMFGGEEVLVVLKCKNSLAGVMMDRFGKDVPFRASEPGYFTMSVRVAVSVHFFTWILNFRGGVILRSPESVCRRFRDFVNECAEMFGE